MKPAFIFGALIVMLAVAFLGQYLFGDAIDGGTVDDTSESFDLSDDEGSLSVSYPVYSQQIQQFAQAIANAEGFFRPGSIPQRANNPGDLKVSGWTGPTLGAEGIPCFDSPDEGWSRLYRQLQLIVDGRSHVYSLSMTIDQMGAKWTDTQPSSWASNVAAFLGVPTSTPLSQVLR